MIEFTREIQFQPAFDRRSKDPSKDYGWGTVQMRWLLKGPKGAIQFMALTGWALPHCANEFRDSGAFDDYPMGSDIGYHSPHPMYEGHKRMSDKCDVLDGCHCYYDGSSLRAEEPMRLLIEQGHEAVWEYMERDYHSRFNQEERV